MDKQTTEGTGSSMNDPHSHNIISQATVRRRGRHPRSAAQAQSRHLMRSKAQDPDRLTEDGLPIAIPPHADALTPRPADADQVKTSLSGGDYRVYAESGEFLMLGRVEDGIMKTVKSS